jgi:hypothetical protein
MAPLRGTASSSEEETAESSVEKDLPERKSTGVGLCVGHLELLTAPAYSVARLIHLFHFANPSSAAKAPS